MSLHHNSYDVRFQTSLLTEVLLELFNRQEYHTFRRGIKNLVVVRLWAAKFECTIITGQNAKFKQHHYFPPYCSIHYMDVHATELIPRDRMEFCVTFLASIIATDYDKL